LNVYHVVAKIDPHCTMPIAGRQIIHNAVASLGQVLAARPEANSQKIEEMRHCHILFISSSEKDQIPALLKALENTSTLTISEVDKFIVCTRIDAVQ